MSPGEFVGRFIFNGDGIAAGLAALAAGGERKGVVHIVDEVGPLEMKGMGWAPALPALVRDPSATVLLTVRPDLVGPVQEKFGFTAAKVWYVSGGAADTHQVAGPDQTAGTDQYTDHHQTAGTDQTADAHRIADALMEAVRSVPEHP